MRVTHILYAQHIGFMFKKHWIAACKRTVPNTSVGVTKYLQRQGIPILDPSEEFKVNFYPKSSYITLPKESIAIDYEEDTIETEEYHTFNDTNVLLEGVPQACVITKSIEINGLPKSIKQQLDTINISDDSNYYIQNTILSSVLYDAEQKKLKIQKDPERPAWNFSRTYGITDDRKNELILSRLLFECEKLTGHSVSTKRKIINDVNFKLPFERDNTRIQMDLLANTIITSKHSLSPIIDDVQSKEFDHKLPDLYPLECTISMPKQLLKKQSYFYPMTKSSNYSNPHTILIHFSDLQVKNLHETPITDSQIRARSLLKAFTVAGASAKFKYGDDVKHLPKPIVVQCVQTDGQSFHFGILQLNTLDLNANDGINNYWFNVPLVKLYNKCQYEQGRPILTGYNNEVFKYMYAFYRNS